MKIIILGCGTSTGVPRIGNDWGACNPNDRRNRRTRSSILVEAGGTRILVDTTPDLRNQLLNNDIDKVDAVIWTHDHADHCHGIDDLRPMFQKERLTIPGYGSARTMESLKRRFSYIFKGNDGYPTICTDNLLTGPTEIGPIFVDAVEQPHGPIESTGIIFRHDGKSVAYAIDFSEITSEMIGLFKDCDLLIVDALRHSPHPTHAHVAMSMDLAARCNAGQVLLSHMDKSLDYQATYSKLPSHMQPAFDGLRVNL